MDHRSDKAYKRCFANALKKKGYKVKISAEPADIIAKCPKGKTRYYELKGTIQTKRYFGSVTVRELYDAFRLPNYYFVIAYGKAPYKFRILSPNEMAKVSYLARSPLAYFCLDLTTKKIKEPKRRKAIGVTKTLVGRILRFHEGLRQK